MRCEHYDSDLQPKNSRGRFFSTKCRKAAWKRKREDQEARLRELVKVLAKKAGLTAEDVA